MASNDDLAFAGALEIRHLVQEKKISPVEITRIFLDRISRLDKSLNSYLTVAEEHALRSAKTAENAVMRGDTLGPLHGVPVSIKDSESTNGVRTTSGSVIYQDRIPNWDSLPVERILGSGAIMLGKTNCPEFAMIGDTTNLLGDACRNPWNTAFSSGGSSGGGAAAVAAGLCSISQGSDGGGSIRGPASFCGVYGIKPTIGRVPRYPGPDNPPTINHFSQHGPLSRTVRDAAVLLQVLSGWDSRDPNALRDLPSDYLAATDKDIKGLKFGWSPDFGGFPVNSEIKNISEQAAHTFEDIGCTVAEYDIRLDTPSDTFWTLTCASIYEGFGKLYEKHKDIMMPYTRRKIEDGSRVTGADYVRALGQMAVIKSKFQDKFEEFDLLINPTTGVPAFPAGEPTTEIEGREVDEFEGYNPFNFNVNMIGYPAASLPCGFTNNGLPVGLQIIGRFGDETRVIAASSAFEAAKPWAQHKPTIS